MTFFLDGKIDMPRRGPNVALPDNSDGIGAGFRSALRGADQFIGLEATKQKEATPLAVQAGERMGVDALHTYFSGRAQETMPGAQTPKYPDVQTYIDVLGPDAVLNAAREQAKTDPAAWADMDFSQETIDAKATERQKAEGAADQELIALSPNPVRNALVGGLGAGVVDPINIAAMPLGLGGGSFLRVLAREALINGGIEAVEFPTRAKVAERLGQEAPSLIGSVAMGAAVGGVFAGVFDGLPRALRGIGYYREMKKVRPDATIRPETQEVAIQSAERAITEGTDPLKAVQQAILSEPPPARRPLILDDSMRVADPVARAPSAIYGDDARNDVRITINDIFEEALAQKERGNVAGVSVTRIDLDQVSAGADAFLNGEAAPPKMKSREGQILADFGYNKAKQQVESLGYEPQTPEPTALAPDPISTQPLEPVPGIPNTTDQIAAVAKKGIAKAKEPTSLKTFVVNMGGIWKGSDGGELAAMGYRRPGFLKKEKFKRSTAGNNGGGRDVDEMRELAAEAGYLPMDSTVADFLDALDGDVRGTNRRYAQGEAGPTTRKTYDPDYVPERAWADPDPEGRGFMVNLDNYEFAHGADAPNAIARNVDEYLAEKGYTLGDQDKREILAVLTTRGGDAEDLIHSAIAREIEEGEYAVLRAERGEAYGGAATGDPYPTERGVGDEVDLAGRGASGKPEAATGNAPEPGARPGEPASERTDIGDQFLIPDTRKLDDYSKRIAKAQAGAKALQSAMRSSLPQQRVEDDAGGLFGGAQQDMFSDPADPKSKPAQIAMVEGLRDDLSANGDFMVDVGNGPVRASTMLRELDDDLDFEDILTACGKRGPA